VRNHPDQHGQNMPRTVARLFRVSAATSQLRNRFSGPAAGRFGSRNPNRSGYRWRPAKARPSRAPAKGLMPPGGANRESLGPLGSLTQIYPRFPFDTGAAMLATLAMLASLPRCPGCARTGGPALLAHRPPETDPERSAGSPRPAPKRSAGSPCPAPLGPEHGPMAIRPCSCTLVPKPKTENRKPKTENRLTTRQAPRGGSRYPGRW
jgi:hypothetical protein